MTSAENSAVLPRQKRHLYWVAAAAASGLAVGLLVPISAVLMWPNEKPQALLKETHVQGRVGETVTLDASSSSVPNRPDARLRFEWSDSSGHLLLPLGIDPEGAGSRVLVISGVAVGEREVILRVTNASRCHRFARLWMSPTACEASDETRAVVEFRPADCKPAEGLPSEELMLESARVIGAQHRNAECRLVLPKRIVTNGHSLEIRDQVPIVAAAGGSRIVAFTGEQAKGAAGTPGSDAPQARDGVLGVDAGNGGVGQNGQAGRDAGPITIVAPALDRDRT